jgi:hypothetical protein
MRLRLIHGDTAVRWFLYDDDGTLLSRGVTEDRAAALLAASRVQARTEWIEIAPEEGGGS